MHRRCSDRRPPGAVLLLFAACLLAGCAPREQVLTAERGEQRFRVISAYEGQAAYLEEVRSGADPSALWREHVVERYREECLEGEYEELANLNLTAARPLDLDRLERDIEALRSSGVEGMVADALRKSAARLPGPDTTVCVVAAGDRQSYLADEEGMGVHGFTAGEGKVVVSVAPGGDWRRWLPYTTAHEYHHSAWTGIQNGRGRGEGAIGDLVDYLVFEGRADSFASLVYPGEEAPWTRALTPTQEERQWGEIARDLDSSDQALWSNYAFGPQAPRWTLYTVGFHAVRGYLRRHPGEGVKAWSEAGSQKILEESGYEGGAP